MVLGYVGWESDDARTTKRNQLTVTVMMDTNTLPFC